MLAFSEFPLERPFLIERTRFRVVYSAASLNFTTLEGGNKTFSAELLFRRKALGDIEKFDLVRFFIFLIINMHSRAAQDESSLICAN